MKAIHVYFKYIRMGFTAGLQYKGWLFMVFQTLFAVVTDPIATILLFSRFGTIGNWSVARVILVYAIAVTSYGLAELFSRGFAAFPFRMIRTGDFDRILLRPQPLTIQIAASYFQVRRASRVFGGGCAIVWALVIMGVKLSPPDLLMLAAALAGGLAAYSGIFIMTSGISFFTIGALDWIFVFTNGSYQVTRCPAPYLPAWLRNAFTFLLPVLVFSYYPASAMCGWGEAYWKGFLALPAGILFLIFSTAIWRIGVRHYQSTGS